MRKTIPIAQLKVGMYVHSLIARKRSVSVKSKGRISNTSMIRKLIENGVDFVEVEQETPEDIDFEAHQRTSSDEPKNTVQKSILDIQVSSQQLHQRCIDSIVRDGKVDREELGALSNDIIQTTLDDSDKVSLLTLLKTRDNYLFEHSINGAFLMVLFANHLGLPQEDISELTTGALLMDIGMATIPVELRRQTGALSKIDWEVIKTHC